ncbi:Uncharacterised protein [Mycobacteroides abscessus subsp. abscessus]|nr:Uncharacterised protein [Mycobacteroides abscessus subsp. abscessus]
MANGFPVCAWVTTMPRSNSPLTMRMKANRSRWLESMPAWTLNTTALNGSVTSRSVPSMPVRPDGAGASSTSASSNWRTPKFSIAEAKIIGDVWPARKSSSS